MVTSELRRDGPTGLKDELPCSSNSASFILGIFALGVLGPYSISLGWLLKWPGQLTLPVDGLAVWGHRGHPQPLLTFHPLSLSQVWISPLSVHTTIGLFDNSVDINAPRVHTTIGSFDNSVHIITPGPPRRRPRLPIQNLVLGLTLQIGWYNRQWKYANVKYNIGYISEFRNWHTALWRISRC